MVLFKAEEEEGKKRRKAAVLLGLKPNLSHLGRCDSNLTHPSCQARAESVLISRKLHCIKETFVLLLVVIKVGNRCC